MRLTPEGATRGDQYACAVPGKPANEDNAIVGSDVHPRAISEEAAAAVAADGSMCQ